MSCFNCTCKFGWLKKEFECKNCGKNVCKDCLTNKAVIPKLSPNEILVCTKCFNNVNKLINTSPTTHQQQPPPSYDDPSTYFGPSMRDIACSSVSNTPQVVSAKDPDVKLRQRLNKLKEKTDIRTVTTSDVESKFLNVTGREAPSASGGDNINKPQVKLTETEEVLLLLEQTKEEVCIDKKYDDSLEANAKINADKLVDMEKRLLVLKGLDPEKVKVPKENDTENYSEDEDEAIANIIKKFALVSPYSPNEATPHNFQQTEDEEELPWCCICNNDAVVRCHGCENDLYCNHCFREFHDDYDTKTHSKSQYRAKSKR